MHSRMELNIRKIFPAKKTDNGSPSWITGGTFLGDGRIMLADYNNPRVLLYEQDGTLLKDLKLCGRPRDLTLISDNEVVVTLPGEIMLQTIDTELMLPKRRIHVGYECYGICVVNENLAVACGFHITFLSLDGNILNTVKVNGLGIRDICSSSNGKLYFTSWNDDCVYCMDEGGNMLLSYKNVGLRYCRGLAVDNDGDVCVVGRWSHNVYKLTSDCGPVAVMMTKEDGLDFPTAIAFHKSDKHGKFFIANNKGKSIMVCDYGRDEDDPDEEIDKDAANEDTIDAVDGSE